MNKPRKDSMDGFTPVRSESGSKPVATNKGGSSQMFDRKADGEKSKGMSFIDRVKYQDKKSGGAYTAPGKLKERAGIQQDKKAAKKAAVMKMMRKVSGK